MVAATAIDVAAFADIPAGNLQDVLGTVYGKAVYAADNVGAALFDANYAKDLANAAQGTATYAANTAGANDGTIQNYLSPTVGKLDSEMSQIFTALGLTRT